MINMLRTKSKYLISMQYFHLTDESESKNRKRVYKDETTPYLLDGPRNPGSRKLVNELMEDHDEYHIQPQASDRKVTFFVWFCFHFFHGFLAIFIVCHQTKTNIVAEFPTPMLEFCFSILSTYWKPN